MDACCRNCRFFRFGKCTILNEVINLSDEDQFDEVDRAIDNGEVAEAAGKIIDKILSKVEPEKKEQLIEEIKDLVRCFIPTFHSNQDIDDPEIIPYNSFKCSNYE